MTTLAAIPVCANQMDLLDLVTDTQTPLGQLHALDFQAACVADGRAHGGWVHPSRVSARLHERFGEIKPQWFSAMWTAGCSPKGFMDMTDVERPIDPKYSRGNGNKKVKLRRLRGVA